jgi:hypothetical protein
MKRRKFIKLSTTSAIALQSSIIFSGCGNNINKSNNNITALSADEAVSSISQLQKKNDILHSNVTNATSNLLQNGTTSELFTRFQNNTLSLIPKSTDIYFSQNEIWTNYLASHKLAYKEASSQLTKLKAGLRVYGYNSSQDRANETAYDLTAASPAVNSAIETFLKAIKDFKNLKFGSVALDGLSLSIKLVLVVLEQVKNSTTGSYYIQLVFKAVESALSWIEEKSLSNLSFSTDTNIILSIAKVGIAALSLLGTSTLNNLQTSTSLTALTSTTSAQDAQTLVSSLSLQSQLIMTLMSVINSVINGVLSATQTLASNVTDPNYQLTEEDNRLIASLKPLSQALAALGLVLKVLLSFYQNTLNAADSSNTLQGDTITYSALFGSSVNSYDTAFSSFTSQNFETLFSSNPTITQLLSELNVILQKFTVTTEPDAQSTTAQAESKAFTLASQLANPSYPLNADAVTKASGFATHLSDLAYQFTMKIENDAYTFAMKGMQYGYLFASRGEEVGLMADRILWMAVQIGQMADRIGEMADRIVYTEQLIVYTEMLILDFGLLIYGGMKQISNVMLMGMAIIFDREWYANKDTQQDPILDVISNMTGHMLDNMQVYEQTVLANQLSLRETTLEALNWIQKEY